MSLRILFTNMKSLAIDGCVQDSVAVKQYSLTSKVLGDCWIEMARSLQHPLKTWCPIDVGGRYQVQAKA